jgi:hypothetical protein
LNKVVDWKVLDATETASKDIEGKTWQLTVQEGDGDARKLRHLFDFHITSFVIERHCSQWKLSLLE